MPLRNVLRPLFVVSALLQVTPGSATTQVAAPIREIAIGSIDDATTALTYVTYAALVADSLVVLSEPFEDRARVFGWDGRLKFFLGRRGAGPGEFTNIARVGPVGSGSHIWVHDAGQQRISIFGEAGSLAREISMRSLGLALCLALLPGDTLVALRSNAASGVDLLLVDGRTTGIVKTLAKYQQRGSGIRVVLPGGRVGTTNPFHDSPLVAASSQNGKTVLVDRRITASARPDSFSVSVFANGTTVRRSFAYRPIPVDDEAVGRAIDQVFELSTTGGGVAARLPPDIVRKAIRDSLKVPRYLAPVSDVLIASDGRVWLRREITGPLARWEVLSSDLRRIETSFWLSSAAQGRIAARDRIWVLEHDALDVPYIVRYRIPGVTTSGR